jgi:hypothetical protein
VGFAAADGSRGTEDTDGGAVKSVLKHEDIGLPDTEARRDRQRRGGDLVLGDQFNTNLVSADTYIK